MDITKISGTTIFIDIIDFLKETNKRGDQKIIQMLNDYYISIGNEVYKNNGQLIKYIGDAVLVFFKGKDHAVNAVKSLLECKFPENIKVHCSVHSGEVYSTKIGHPKLLSNDIFGDNINITALQEKAYDKNKLTKSNPYIIISETTNNLLNNKFKSNFISQWKIRTTENMIKSYQIIK